MSLLQINPYEVNSFKRSSYTREVAQEIYKIFGPVTLDFLHCYSADHNDRPNHRPYGYVPNYLDELCIRENMLVSPANRLFNISIFYYIKFLTDLNPDKIVDIGCDNNLLKKVCPIIYGISDNPKHVNADEISPFNSEFSKKHQNQFQCAMSICSLHFVSVTKFEQRVADFVNIVKPGGRGFVTFNIIRSIESSDDQELEQLFQTTNPTNQQIALYIDQKIKNMPFKFLVVENLIDQVKDESMNGNVRLVFEK